MLTLYRTIPTKKSTIGELHLDGEILCDTLEDCVRDGDDEVLQKGEKIYGQTAIPLGTYEIVLRQWDKYGCKMPLLLNVPLYEGIFIHPGNTDAHSLGCILVGQYNPSTTDYVSNSRVTFFEKVLPRIHDYLDSKRLYIQIFNKTGSIKDIS